MLPCTIVVATICLPWDGANVRLSSGGLTGQFAIYQSELGEVMIHQGSDAVEGGSWELGGRACEADRCVDYRRQDKGLRARFLIRMAGCDVARVVEVEGRTPEKQRELLESVAAIPPTGTARHAIRLSRLSRQSRDATRDERMSAPPTSSAACVW